MFIEHPRGPAVDPAVIEALKRVSPSTLGHLSDFGFMRGLTAPSRPVKLGGPAVTVRWSRLNRRHRRRPSWTR